MNAKFSIIIFLVLASCAPAHDLGLGEIDSSCGPCLIEGEINGKKTYFVLDTGAAVTTLDMNQSHYFGFTLRDADLEITGFNSDIGEMKRVVGIDSIKINGRNIIASDTIYANNMSRLSREIESCTRKRIGGIIGVPIIKRYGLVIDLMNNKLYSSTH
ncbi:MAG TPA: aspartyl protease family protein [Chitinophagaceae bacterium]|nr:aspartyl protease family protein [Chitinophagaceae bacterium]